MTARPEYRELMATFADQLSDEENSFLRDFRALGFFFFFFFFFIERENAGGNSG